jgi:hypothetical protein
MAIEIFFSYSHKDEIYLEALKSQLSPLQKKNHIDIMWHDRNISAGREWEREIDYHLSTAHIILLLVSSDFVFSNYCSGIEMQRALDRHERGEARVIPIILRPCLWQDTPLAKLQPLPKEGKAVSDWPNFDAALFAVAQGMREVIEEIRTQQLAREISLCGYETDGGTNSILWKNPQKLSDEKGFASWLDMKRPFRRGEIVNQTWIKVSHWGDYWINHFEDNGSLRECFLFCPNKWWSGSWKLIDGKLRINIGRYEIDVFAQRENLNHSAIEFEHNGKEARAYHTFFPVQEKQREEPPNLQEASVLVAQMCKQILSRQPKPEELILFGSLLCRDEKSVRDIVSLLALSPGYRERFIDGKILDEAIELCYQHLFGRRADSGGKAHYLNKLKKIGFETFILELIGSPEYTREFGEDVVPSDCLLETDRDAININLFAPRPMATLYDRLISARGSVWGLDTKRNHFITAYIITNREYEQGRSLIDDDGSWTIEKIHLAAIHHRLFFRITAEFDTLVATSKETTIIYCSKL